MSLKGYEWLHDGKVVAWFTFKRCTLCITNDATQQDVEDFKKYISQHGFTILEEIHEAGE